MKKSFFRILVIGLVTSFSMQAQVINGLAGLGGATFLEGEADNTKFNLNLHLGANYQHFLIDKLSIEAGLQYTLKGTRVVIPNTDFGFGIFLHYLEFPIILRYEVNVFNKDIFLDAGYYRAMGVFGHATSDLIFASNQIKFDGSQDGLVKWEGGWTFGGGWRTKKIVTRISFDISNTDIDSSSEGSWRNAIIKISVIKPIFDLRPQKAIVKK